MLLGVEPANDLDSIGKVLVGEVPDPLGSIAEHSAECRAIETTVHRPRLYQFSAKLTNSRGDRFLGHGHFPRLL